MDYVSDKWEFFETLLDIERYHSQRILDIGCGSGDFLALLKSQGLEGLGYEFSPEVAKFSTCKRACSLQWKIP